MPKSPGIKRSSRARKATTPVRLLERRPQCGLPDAMERESGGMRPVSCCKTSWSVSAAPPIITSARLTSDCIELWKCPNAGDESALRRSVAQPSGKACPRTRTCTQRAGTSSACRLSASFRGPPWSKAKQGSGRRACSVRHPI